MEHLTECEQHDTGEECERCADLFTACAECGAFGIAIDSEGMAAELCEACENPPAVIVARLLSELSVDLEEMHLPDMSDRMKEIFMHALADAVVLLRTHAVPPSHPWAVK
jgi:hypothetical protein